MVAAALLAGVLTLLTSTPAGATTCGTHLFGSAQLDRLTSIDTGPDGALWFTSSGTDRVGRIDPGTGQITTVTGVGDEPVGIATGPDGNVWFTAYSSGQIGRIVPGSTPTVTLFPAAPNGNGYVRNPQAITLGPDGNLWFTSYDSEPEAPNSRVGKINPSTGNIATYASQTSGGSPIPGALDVITGPDGNLWFSATGTFPVDVTGRIARFAPPVGPAPVSISVVAASTSTPALTLPGGLAAGPDGNVWATSIFNDSILRITPGGTVTPFTAPDVFLPQQITGGRPGEQELWFAPADAPARVGVIATDGTIRTYSAGGASSYGVDVEVGPDGNIWFVTDGGQVGYVDPDDPGPRFVDMTTTHPFCAEVAWMDEQGISTGYADITYRPAAQVTRQAMSAFLYRLAGSPPFPDPATPTFGDVATSSPFFTEIEWMAAEGISGGTPASPTPHYKPSVAVSRGAMSAFMYRLADPQPPFEPPAVASFDDVSTGHPFFREVEWMASEQITTGYTDGTFKPAAPVTRQAMSAFMTRLADLLEP